MMSIGMSREEKNREGGKKCEVRRRDQRATTLLSGFPTEKGYPFSSAGVQANCSLAGALFGLSSHRQRCKAEQVPLAVDVSSIRVTILAPWGLPP